MKPQYLNLIDIPEGKIGDFTVTHKISPPGEEFDTANLRCALFAGQKREKLSWPHPTRWTYLQHQGATLIADLPCEVAQHYQCLEGIRGGSVLVGGLGLGITLAILAQRKGVHTVVVVEQSQEVIDLVWKHRKFPNAEIICADLDEWVKTNNRNFTHAFYDTWSSDGEGTFFHTVCPLYEHSYRFVGSRPRCWNEDVMRGQLVHSLQMRVMVQSGKLGTVQVEGRPATPEDFKTPKGSIFWDWSVPFFRRGRLDNDAIKLYCSAYGLPQHADLWKI